MKFAGFNFTKISIERLSNNLDGLKINTNIDTSKIELIKGFEDNEERVIKVEFSYLINYEPDFAKIEFKGEVFISEEKERAKEIINEWKEDKKLDKDFRIFLFNILLRKCNLKALELEEEVNLPLHIPLPRVTKENLKEKE